MLVSPIVPSTSIHPLFKEQTLNKIVRIALPIIVVAGVTVGMISCSVFAPIPFLVILGAAGTLSVSHTFAVRTSPDKYLQFLREECDRLRKGELPSVTSEEMAAMVRSMKFQSLMSKTMLVINAIFLMAPLCMRDYTDYTKLDRLIPIIEFYGKLIAEPPNMTVQWEKDEIKKVYPHANDQKVDKLYQKEAKFRKEKTNYQKYSRARLLLALDKLLYIDGRAFNAFLKRDKDIYEMLSRLAVMEELENAIYLNQSNCPPTLKKNMREISELQELYRKTALRNDKERLAVWFIEDKPQIQGNDALKKLYDLIKEYAANTYSKDEDILYKTSKTKQQYLQHLQKHLSKAVKEALKIDDNIRIKIKTNDQDAYAPVYRLCLLEELVNGKDDDKQFLEIQKEIKALSSNQKEELKKSLVLGEGKGGQYAELVKKISYLAKDASSFNLCNEKILRQALAEQGLKQTLKYRMYCIKSGINGAANAVFYVFP